MRPTFKQKAVLVAFGVMLLAPTIPAWVVDLCPPKPQSCTPIDTHREHLPERLFQSVTATSSGSLLAFADWRPV